MVKRLNSGSWRALWNAILKWKAQLVRETLKAGNDCLIGRKTMSSKSHLLGHLTIQIPCNFLSHLSFFPLWHFGSKESHFKFQQACPASYANCLFFIDMNNEGRFVGMQKRYVGGSLIWQKKPRLNASICVGDAFLGVYKGVDHKRWNRIQKDCAWFN